MIHKRLAFGIVILCLSGCGGPGSRNVSFSAWQKNVENYVTTQGKGDPTVLRDVTIADGRKGYAMLGTPVVSESTDATGVLLGLQPIAGTPSFVYLVGLCERGKLKDIRLAAVSFHSGKSHWWIGRANPSSLHTYVKSLTPASTASRLSQNFPAPGDVFKLDADSNRLTASHEATGAVWSMSIGHSK